MKNIKRDVASEAVVDSACAFSAARFSHSPNIVAAMSFFVALSKAARSSLSLAKHLGTALIIAGAMGSSMAHAQVVWEDYQGDSRVTGTSGQDYPGPSFPNGVGTDAQIIAALKALSSNPANASRTGASTAINFTAASLTLCNLDPGNDPAGTGPACQFDVQGRVLWTVLKFPAAGSYSFSVAHDDQVDIDMSTTYATTAYKTASYDLPVGSLASYTASDTTYENVPATFVAPAANNCALVRIYWSNAGGINHLRLRWTKPGGVTEIIPTAQLNTPGQTAAAMGCAGAVTTNQTSVLANKIVGATGRANAADQFQVSIANGATSLASAVTSGTDTGQQASTGAQLAAVGTTYTITDAMAAGSSSALGAYTPTIACTRNGTAFTPGGSAPSWTVSPTAVNQKIVCNITNTRKTATLQLRKQWVNAPVNDAATIPATTGFSANTAALNAVANTSNEIDAGTSITVLVGETGTLKAESITTGFPVTYAKTLGCTGATPAGTDAGADNSLTIPSTAGGTTIICTYNNSYTPVSDLTVTKANGIASVLTGHPITYTITVTNNGPSTSTGAKVTDTPVSGITCPSTNAVTVSSGGSYTVADLTGAGITLGTIANGDSVTLSYSCTVD